MAVPSNLTPQSNALPPGTDVAQLELEAGAMTRASIAGYGTTPDPQLATEALLTGSSPTLSSALASGDPALQKTLLSQPIGQSQFTSLGIPPPTALYNDPFSYDPKQHAQMIQAIPEDHNTFKSMNDLPVANSGWYNSILTGDANTVKKWQQFLSDQGFYGNFDANGQNFKKGEVNGYNTPDFQNGLKQWAVSYFLPQALYSRDPQELTNAKQFLSTSLGIDTNSIASTMAYDPAQREKAVDGWLRAQGPGANKIQALNLFADQFGADALPEQLNQLRGDGVFGHIGDFVHHFIPFIGSSDEDKLKKLTPAEQELIAPSLQKAHDKSPFMQFIGDVFSAPSKALVTTALFFGNAAHGDVENPFDDHSKIRGTADWFVNNPVQAVFGEQFVKDHTFLSTLGNIAINVFDDPLTYIPFVGEVHLAEKLGAGATDAAGNLLTGAAKTAAGQAKMTKVEKATGGLISHRVGTLRYGAIGPKSIVNAIKTKDASQVLQRALNPIEMAQQDIAKALTSKNIDHGLVRDMLDISSEDDFDKVEKILELGKSGDHMNVLSFLRDPKNKLSDRLFDMGHLMNRHEYDKILRNAKDWDPSKALPVWHTLHMNDSGSLMLMDRPNETLDALRNSAQIAGVDPKEFGDFATSFWKTTGDGFSLKRLSLAQGMDKKIADAFQQRLQNTRFAGKSGLEGYHAFQDQLRQGSRNVKGDALYAAQHVPGEAGKETSFVSATKFTKDSGGYTAQELNDRMSMLEDTRNSFTTTWQHALDAAARNYGGSPEAALADPMIKDIQGSYQKAVKDVQKEMDQMVSEHGGTTSQKAAPLLTTQNAIYHHTKFTPSEMAAYVNPALRKSEWIQRRWGIDHAMNVWKTLVLSKPSTTARIMFGDESSRGHIHLLMNDQRVWWNYMKGTITRHGYKPEKFIVDHPELIANAHMLSQMGAGLGKYVPMVAGESQYRRNLTQLIEQHYGKQQWVKEWTKAVEQPLKDGGDWERSGQDALDTFFRGDHQEARDVRDFAKVPDIKKGSNSQLDQLVATRHNDLRTLLHPDPRDPNRMKMFEWLKKGKVNQKDLVTLEKKVKGTTDETYVLPQIQGIPPMMGSPVGNWAERYHEWAAHRITNARGRVFAAKTDMEHRRLKKYYEGQLKEGSMTETEVAQMADSAAARWVRKNTYQGSRSVLGNTMRTVAPFWGATANSNRFYLHSLAEHPEVAVPLAQGEQQITQAQGTGGLKFNLPVVGNMLSHLGFASGDQFTWQPFNSLFLTREGFGGLLPGAGPVFNVALGAMPPSLKDWISQDVPGMQYASSSSPVLPWLTDTASAVSLAMGGSGIEAPFVGRSQGYYEKQTDNRLQQMEANWEQGGRQGPAPTIDDAKREVARSGAVTSAAGFALPFSVGEQDQKKAQINQLEQTWSPGLAEADKKALYDQNPDVADYFKYVDPHTPQTPVSGKESKQDILQRSPWVLAYTTSTAQSNVPGRATEADTNAQYKRDVESGAITTLSPLQYIDKMRQKEESTQAWNAFDRLQNSYQDFLVGSGVTTNSTQAKQWRKGNYDPYLQELVKEYPGWGSTFVKQTSQSAVGQQYASEPFYSVSTFNVIPQNPALETKATTLWRAALIRRDQAVSALQQVMASGGSQQEKQMILTGLAQELDQFATQDPTFASQISKFRYNNIDDLVSFQAGQAADQQQGYPVA